MFNLIENVVKYVFGLICVMGEVWGWELVLLVVDCGLGLFVVIVVWLILDEMV